MTEDFNPLRAFFIGCVRSSDVALQALLADPNVHTLGVLTLSDGKINADFVDISVRAKANDVPVYLADQLDKAELTSLLIDLELDVIFVIGWSRLLAKELIEIPKLAAVGYHPAALPSNRGRHPLIWALTLGLTETASSFFLMDEGADSGPILSQVRVPIAVTDHANDLYAKLLAAIPAQLREVTSQLLSGLGDLKPQNHSIANYWRKRSRSDGRIDWRMTATGIYNLVRALSHPYHGAEFAVGDRTVTLWRCEVIECGVPENAEPGKILDIEDGGIVVKAGFGAVRLIETTNLPDSLRQGDYL